MEVEDYYKPIETMWPDEVREFMKSREPEEFSLIDVRQPKEYEQEHLPGAKLIPLGELDRRIGELDPGKTVILY